MPPWVLISAFRTSAFVFRPLPVDVWLSTSNKTGRPRLWSTVFCHVEHQKMLYVETKCFNGGLMRFGAAGIGRAGKPTQGEV
jgi:hypothetical protein